MPTPDSKPGDDWIPWTPKGGGKPHADPKTTPLTAFPQFPVVYFQPSKIDPSVPAQRYIQSTKDATFDFGSRLYLARYVAVARSWVRIAASVAPSKPSSAAWIARLRREFGSHPLQVDCTVRCRPQMERLYQIANAAQYLAGMWSPTKVHPPSIPPDKDLLEWLSELAGEKVGGALATKFGIGLGVVAAGFLVYKVADARS